MQASLLGTDSRLRTSSLVMACSAPGMPILVALPPTASRMCFVCRRAGARARDAALLPGWRPAPASAGWQQRTLRRRQARRMQAGRPGLHSWSGSGAGTAAGLPHGAHREALAIHVDGVCVDDLAAPLVVGHARAVQDLHVYAVQPVQLFVLVVHEPLPDDRGLLRVPPASRRELSPARAHALCRWPAGRPPPPPPPTRACCSAQGVLVGGHTGTQAVEAAPALHSWQAHPKALLSWKEVTNSPPMTMSFFGTHPLSTQVPAGAGVSAGAAGCCSCARGGAPPAPPFVSDEMRSKGSSQMAVRAPAHAHI